MKIPIIEGRKYFDKKYGLNKDWRCSVLYLKIVDFFQSVHISSLWRPNINNSHADIAFEIKLSCFKKLKRASCAMIPSFLTRFWNMLVMIFQGLMVSSMDGQKRLILPNEEMQGSAITDPSSYTLCRGTGMIVWHKVAFGKIQNQSFQKSNEKQVTHCSRNFEKKIKK